MKEISKRDGSRYFIVNVLDHENMFKIVEEANENEAKKIFAKIESADENILIKIAMMHSSNLLMTVDGINLVDGSQNLHEAIRIYEHLSESDNQDIAKTSKYSLELIKEKYKHTSLLSNKYYYLKVGENFVYTDRGKIYQMKLNDYHDYVQFNKTLKGLEKESKISQYNMGARLSGIDKEESIEYYKRSAKQGYVNAQYNLGWIMKERGNIEEAIQWFKLAAEQGDEEALKQKEQLQENYKTKDLEEDNIGIGEKSIS